MNPHTKKRKNPSVLQSLGIRKPQPKPVQPPTSTTPTMAQKRMKVLAALTSSQASRELQSAARSGDIARANYLLTSVPTTDVNYKSSASEDSLGKGATSLHFAALNGHHEIINLLLRCGAACGATTESGSTPLHVATKKGHVEAVKCLLSFGGPTLRVARDNLGRSAFWYASIGTSRGHQEISRFLK